MSALVAVPRVHPRPERHLQLVRPGFVPSPAAGDPREGSPARLTARGRRVRALLLFVLAVILCVGLGALCGQLVGAGTATQPEAAGTITVQPGETLWEVARAAASPQEDVRAVAGQIARLNGLDEAGLRVGQVLQLPA